MTIEQPNFFSDGSPFLTHPLLTGARTESEINFVETVLALPRKARVLDVGCGFGRHSIELAKRGYTVVGIDPSPVMIHAAQERASAAGVSVDFRCQSGEQFFEETAFDAAICLFTTLGQITEAGENSGLLRQVNLALKRGGRFLVEVPQRDTAVHLLKPSDTFYAPGDRERHTVVTRRFNVIDSIVTEDFQLNTPEQSKSYRLQYRLYDRQELFAQIEGAGFSIKGAYGDYAGSSLADEHAIMVLLGEKV